jgi:hypothetical protein
MVLTLLVVPLLAGCGDDDSGGGGDTPTKEEFIEQADKLCEETDEEGTALVEQSFADPTQPTASEAQAFIEAAVPIQRDLLQELRELDRPEGDEDEIERWLDAADEGTNTVEEAGETPESSLELLQNAEEPLTEANDLAAEYGLNVCSD